MKARVCELCNGEASVYCASDSAFLCWNCDAEVHGANFLVARHVRHAVCSECKGFDGNRISGVGFRPFLPICRFCSPESQGDDLDSLSSSSSSACVSITASFATAPKKVGFDQRKIGRIVSSGSVTDFSVEESNFPARFSGEVTSRTTTKKKSKKQTKTLRSRATSTNVDAKVEGILVNWCSKMGLNSNCGVPLASQAFGVCLEKLTVLPFRVTLAASLWFSFRLCGDRSASTCHDLKRLVEISGVPAKLILAAESKLTRVLKVTKPRRDQDQEEGCAECSP